MISQDRTKSIPSGVSLEQAITLARSGRKTQAAEMLRQLVASQPVNQAAWLWLSAVTSDGAEARSALSQAKKIDPTHPSLPRAEQWLIHRFSKETTTRRTAVEHAAENVSQPAASPGPPSAEIKSIQSPSKRVRAWYSLNAMAFGVTISVVILGLVILFMGLVLEVAGAAQANSQRQVARDLWAELETAQLDANWIESIAILTQLQELEPENQAIVSELAHAYFQQGLALRSRGFVADALESFKRAEGFDSGILRLPLEIELASRYVAGADFYQAGQWKDAVSELEPVWQQDRTYINVRDLLYSAYYNHALAQDAAGQSSEAIFALKAAIALRPDLSEPRRMLAEVEFARTAGTPAYIPGSGNIENRLILVGIAEQKMWVFEDDKKVFDFVVSTGEPGRDTAVGEFEILDKIENAYASTWNLDMPYWMGIYWAGPLENGIHALPIVKHTGYKLWDGYLGQRVSYGCIILGDEDASTLFNWTEVGTKVKIVPSLAHWTPEREE